MHKYYAIYSNNSFQTMMYSNVYFYFLEDMFSECYTCYPIFNDLFYKIYT